MIAIGLVPLFSACSQPKQTTEKTTVVFATVDLPLAQVIALTDLSEREMELGKVPANAVHRKDLVAGRYSRGIKRGQLITSRYIVPAGGLLNQVLPSVVHSTTIIPAGYYISPDAIEEKPLEIEKIPSNIYECNKKTFENSYARSDIKKGEMLSFASFTPEAGRHYIFARHNLKAESKLTRADIQVEDQPSPQQANTLSVETLLKMKLKSAVRRGQQITMQQLY